MNEKNNFEDKFAPGLFSRAFNLYFKTRNLIFSFWEPLHTDFRDLKTETRDEQKTAYMLSDIYVNSNVIIDHFLICTTP